MKTQLKIIAIISLSLNFINCTSTKETTNVPLEKKPQRRPNNGQQRVKNTASPFAVMIKIMMVKFLDQKLRVN